MKKIGLLFAVLLSATAYADRPDLVERGFCVETTPVEGAKYYTWRFGIGGTDTRIWTVEPKTCFSYKVFEGKSEWIDIAVRACHELENLDSCSSEAWGGINVDWMPNGLRKPSVPTVVQVD